MVWFIIQRLNIEIMEKQFTPSKPDLTILEYIEMEPDTTQASLADRLGVAVGTINWHIKRLIEKGYVKVKRAERKKLRYIITPEGISLRAKLLIDFIHSSMEMYRLVRERSAKAIRELKNEGWKKVRVEGDGDIAEILRLTCFEQGMTIVNDSYYPKMKVVGLKIFTEKGKTIPHGK
ncbi:MAG: winged helix-turn-helix transcriptional regulator [Anaerolineaceae bacterium]|nr:winged helix-turn-helix transcriptional regulator [Anaerolineaceae bacterium]